MTQPCGTEHRPVRPPPAHAHTQENTQQSHLDLLALDDSGTTQTASAAGSNETALLARGRKAVASGGVTNVLVVTTTVGVLHGVHGHTTHLWGESEEHPMSAQPV